SPGSSSSPSTKPSPSPSGTPYLADPVTLVGLSGQAPAALAIDGATLWAYDVESGDLSAVDTVAGRETGSIHFGGLGSHVIRGARPDAIWALDPKTNRLVRTIPLDDVSEILAMDIDGTDAWIGARRDGTGYVLRIDLSDGHLVGHHLRPLPAAIRILGDRVWV